MDLGNLLLEQGALADRCVSLDLDRLAHLCKVPSVVLDGEVEDLSLLRLGIELHNGGFHLVDQLAVVARQVYEGAVHVDFVEDGVDVALEGVVGVCLPLALVTTRGGLGAGEGSHKRIKYKMKQNLY